MFKEFTQYVTCMLGGECPTDKKENDNVTIENESEEPVVDEEPVVEKEPVVEEEPVVEKEPVVDEDKSVDEVDSQSSTPRMFTFFTNKDNIVDDKDNSVDENNE